MVTYSDQIDFSNYAVKPLSEVERDYIFLALHAHKFNKTKTAKALKIGIRTLQRKLIKYKAEGYI